ncbi:unnamed protein product [Parnassius apollo]|uniref:(apollo) hypothetical protein n=1 Tax=Parnassius apollo TaxID=110799 RepID=A0A8S3X2L5_PARAO|nr:unnamed protein product [Parnassius apollo]
MVGEFLLKNFNKVFKIIPSEYEKEMRLSTEERLQSLNNVIIDNIVNNREDKKHAVLSFTPRIIIFQNFKPNDKYVTKFSVKNISKVPTYLKMVFKESPYFSIKMNRPQPLSRLAPGISASFIITFIPTLLEDYIHKITFYTDLDKYIVPLIGMGPRPIFNFPDELTIPKAPLKVESNYLLTIRNVGMVPSGFTLDTKCPFSVQPKSAYLNCDEQIEIKVSFKTMHLGYTQELLRVVYETGEKFIIKLSGTAHAVSVELEKQIIKFPETYNGMVQQQILKISNKSDYVLTYMCMKNECVYYDFKDKVKLATVFYNLKESEAAKCAKLVRYDVLSSTEHERVYTRIFCDEIQALVADETLYFRDSHYSISPVRGQLWPNKTSEITLTFSPTQIGELDAIAYFDIDGVADRIPLKLSGTSLPPSIHLNLETLDMSSVYINKKYNYEIIAINNGHINGVILYKESSTLFGSKITCTPVCRSLRPGEKDMFVVSFLNSNPGPFLEEINFIIRDTDVKLKVFLKGEIIYPSVIFSVPSLDFGDISLGMKIQHKQLVVVEIICKYFNLFCEGVPKTLILELINESNVHVSGVVKIPSDGLGISSITLTDYAYADHPKPEIPRWPREFEIEPSKIIMDPESMIILKVTLTANLIRSHRTALELELEKSDRRSLTLPITYNATIPYLTPAPNINLRACFLDYPYVNVINVTSNDFCGYFTTEELKLNRDTKWEIEPREDFIEPESEKNLTVNLYLVDAETQSNKAVIQIENMKDILVPLTATGVGTSIVIGDLGDRIELGHQFTRIPLKYKVKMKNQGTKMHVLEWSEHYKMPKKKQQAVAFFNLEPRCFKMYADEELELTVTGNSNKVALVKETWYLVGSIEGINKKELLLECEVTADFIDPKIEISSPLLDFQCDRGPYSEFYKLTASNISEVLSQRSEICSVKITGNTAIASEAIKERISEINIKLENKIMKTIVPMIGEEYYDPKFKWISKLSHTTEHNYDRTNDMLLLIPHRGKLKPNEIQYVNVMFRPQNNINIRAVIECEVLGGPSEFITVTGQSSDLKYSLSTREINFKIRCFQENAYEYVRICNKALLPFDLKTYLNESKYENELNATILEVVPPEKVLHPDEGIDIKVIMRPGVLGYFKRVFLLEIGHQPIIPIEVFGWGVIPQVYLSIPRLNIIEDVFPSIMDIEMSIERILLINYLNKHPEVLNAAAQSTVTRTRPISGFTSTPYVIDFGVVITGSTVHYTVEAINYGPTITKLHLSKNTSIPDWLSLKLCGKLNPGEVGRIDVTFSPTTVGFPDPEQCVETVINLEVTYEGLLIFRFHMNPKRMTIPIIGYGVLPKVHIIGPNISFPPTLPWAETTEYFFGLTNPCPFPIELIIAHSDTKWQEEEEIYQLLNKYYNKPEEMLVPAIKPGSGLPPEIREFYQKFKESIKKYAEEASKIFTTKTLSVKKTKSPKNAIKTISQSLEVSPRHHRTEVEIIEEEQCQEMAYSVGKKLNLPTLSVDLCFVEALCVSNCQAKQTLNRVINEIYEVCKSGIDKEDINEQTEEINETIDEFETMLDKIKTITNNKTLATPKSRASEKRKKRSTSSLVSHTALEAMGSTTMFNLELIQELLTDFLDQPKFDRGFVIDSLTSAILRSPSIVLTTILKCKPTILKIHLVLCQSNFNKWAQTYEESQKDDDITEEIIHKEYSDSEIEEIINSFENMTDEEYENASPELRSIYILRGLEDRRRKHYLKAGVPKATVMKEKDTKGLTSMKSLLAVDKSESKKKIKKDDLKGKPTSEYLAMNIKYNDYYKNIHENLINIANNWIVEQCDLGSPLIGLSGQVVGQNQKKSKKKSELHLQVSEVSFTERGFPLTLITCPCINYKEAVVNMFASSPSLQNALRKTEKSDIFKHPIQKNEFTVLLPKIFPVMEEEESLKWVYLDEMPIKKCECNFINDLNVLDDLCQDNVLNILSKWNCSCGKKVISSQTSTTEFLPTSSEMISTDDSKLDITPYPLPLYKVKSIINREERIILQTGDLVRCKYTFSPKVEGKFNVKRFVQVNGWPASQVVVNVTGICDLPRLDNRPKKMFKNFVRRQIEDNVYKGTYLDDVKVFQFGPIFIGNNRKYEEKYVVDLKNASLITTDVDIEFLHESEVFRIDKKNIKLEPECRGKLIVSAAPAVIGEHKNVLLFCIKNNPEIVEVNIACSGVVPIVEILPSTKVIDYGKHLLYRREDDRFIVKNDSILPIMWKIRNANEFLENFIISQTSGVIPRHRNHVVPVTYLACKVEIISNKILLIDIYDSEGRGDPMIVDSLYLSAECYDVMVECAYENMDENLLNFGNVKVNLTVARQMYLFNRGKYNIYYKLKKVKNFPEPSLLKSFEVTPECGVLPATTKLVTVEFECMPTTSLNLVNVPVYTCSLLDDSRKQTIVAKFPICVTIASFYNTFTLFPLGELNFHVIPVGVGVLREVILNNTSKCPFTYEIILPSEYQVGPDNVQSTKGKDNKIKNPPLNCGNFVIMNEDNLLAPFTSRTIQIQFLATAAKTFEETIHFVVSDTCPAEANGVPLKLVGTGAIPTLDFWNLETTFREHLIVKNMSEYKVPEPSPHCVFVEDTVTLHFFGVVVNTNYIGAIDLYNNGLVPCALKIKLHYQANSNQEIFSLDKYETHIEPLMHKNLNIIFSPKALEVYKAVLEVKLKKVESEEQSFRICLIGEGVIPRIRIIYPQIKKDKHTLLEFPVTCLGSITNRQISFKSISSINVMVIVDIIPSVKADRPLFWLTAEPDTDHIVLNGNNDNVNITLKVTMKPSELVTLTVHYSPLEKGKTNCEIKLTVVNNPFENYTILCNAEAFMEDVILVGLEMLSMDVDLETYKMPAERSTASTTDTRKKNKSAQSDKKKLKIVDSKKSKRFSQASMKQSDTSFMDQAPTILKYLLDFGGCELCLIQRRSVIMVNNSEKVYKFSWIESDNIIVRPSAGYISPGEEKDLEVIFYSAEPVDIEKEFVSCFLTVVSDNSLTENSREITWDTRQTVTLFNRNRDVNLNERCDITVEDQIISPNNEPFNENISIVIIYSVKTEYTKYECDLEDEKFLQDTFIYQTRCFNFEVKNVGRVPMKITWSFVIDDEFPIRITKSKLKEDAQKVTESSESTDNTANERDSEILAIEKNNENSNSGKNNLNMILVNHKKTIILKMITKLNNLDPYDQNITCKITAKSLIPYVHLDIEESDYLTSGRRKATEVALPELTTVLEFKVLGAGCYKKSFNVINPTTQSYEFIFEVVMTEEQEFVPVHCNKLKGYVEGGTSTEVVFTFSPPSPGVYESQWKFKIPTHSLVMNLLVVGFIREPDVEFVPKILLLKNSLVGFTSETVVRIKNNENESLGFEFKGNSLCDESGETPVVIYPERGILKPHFETPIKISYTPIQDGPLSFKIFCGVKHLTKLLTLCVNALSLSIKPVVTYYLIGNEHILKSDAVTNIHLDKTASTYKRTIPFTIKNDGSATIFFDWHYSSTPVKKYLEVNVEPRMGHVSPGNEVECILYFHLIKVPVRAFPVSLSITDGPRYNMYLYAEIEKPSYHFSCKEYDFGMCFVNAPDSTYKKNIAFENADTVPLTLDLNFSNLPELYVEYYKESSVQPNQRLKISIYFRPKDVKMYEFKLQFWVNSLCEETVVIKGEGIPLLFDLYDGCQKSFDLGPVKVGDKIVRQIEVMNHSKAPIDASFIFRDTYPAVDDTNGSEATSICLSPGVNTKESEPGKARVKMLQNYKDNKIKEQIALDVQNALSSLKVVPNKCTVQPYRKVPLKIQFKPIGLISTLNVQASCNIENYVPLELALYATCVDTGAFQNKTLYMECPVRETQTDHIVVTNPTDEMWLVLSEVSGESFETLKEFNIEANTTFEIPIHFKPKSFGKHEGQVLFSPLGESALFINVVGIATRPNPNGDITLTIKAKDPYTEELLVYNITEVRFTNEKTREYQFYNIAILVTPSGIMGTLTFESRARESVQKELSISNPLAEDTEFNIHCEHLESPDKLMISRNSKATLSMTYSPLVVGVTEEYLEVSNPLVGTYLYKVILKCLPAKEKNLEFTTPLGTSVPLRLRAHNKTDTRAEFTATVSHPSIIVEKEYALDPFEKGKFQAWFEPTEIGRQVCRVSLKSAIAGEFVYNIQGIATEPKPQGPYEVKSGGSTTIRFKNVFEGDRVFKLSVDRKEFYVKSSYESLKPKKV